MFAPILKVVEAETSGELAMNELARIRAIDRWFTFPRFLESAQSNARRMEEFGLAGAAVEEFPADGETFFGHWQMPYAWDAEDARLTVRKPERLAGRLLAHYRAVPCSLTMWSAPTPPGGTVAEVVVVEDGSRPEHYRGLDVKGKIVFSSSRTSASKREAARRGAVGILSDWNPHPEDLPDERFWNNAFSDDPGGWGLIKGDARLFGFSVTPRVGRELRGLLARGEKLVLHAQVSTRIYPGIMPVATGYIPGARFAGTRPGEQVLTLGHGFEQGANDNASGCAVMLEATRALSELIRAGKLRPPRRNIRVLITWECYATLAYAARHPDEMRGTVAGLCIDHVGQKQELCRTIQGLILNPHAQANVTDAFALELARRYFDRQAPRYRWLPRPFGLTDNIVVDPTIGVPTVTFGPGVKDLYWHTTGDTEETVDVAALKLLATFAATYLYFLASAGPKEAYWLAQQAAAEGKAAIAAEAQGLLTAITTATSASALGGSLGAARERLGYVGGCHADAVRSAERLLAKEERGHLKGSLGSLTSELRARVREEVSRLEREAKAWAAHLRGKLRKVTRRKSAAEKRAERLVPVRVDLGPPALDRVPPAERGKLRSNRWNGGLHRAFWWSDGKRTLAEVIRLTAQETGHDCWHLVAEFEALARHGLIRLERKK
jgi:hypothetical protein